MPFTPNRQGYLSQGSSSSYSSPYGSSSSNPPLNSLLLGRYESYNNPLLRSSYSPFPSSSSSYGPYGQVSSYTSPYGSISSYSYGGGGGGGGPSSYKSSFSSLAPISEHSVMSSYSSGGPSRLPRGYVPPSFPTSSSNYSPSVSSSYTPSSSSYSSYKNKPQVWHTENIDVTSPRKKPVSSSTTSTSSSHVSSGSGSSSTATATPGEISRDKQFGTIKRGRTVIRITTNKQKDNPFLTEEENKARAEERKKERNEENLLEKLKNELKNELQNKPGKKAAAGDKFREKFMIQSKKKKYAGYRRPTLTDIRDEKDALEGELDEMISSNASAEEIEQVRERLRQLDKRIQRRFSRALKKADNASSTNLNLQDDDGDESMACDIPRKSTVIKRSTSSSQPFPEEEKRLQRKATQKFFFPAEGASAVEPELVEDNFQPEVDLFEQHILASRGMSQRKTSNQVKIQNVKYIRPRKSSITSELLDMANLNGATTPNSETPLISPVIVKKTRKISSTVAPPVPIPEPPVEETELETGDSSSKADDVAQKEVVAPPPVIVEKKKEEKSVAPWRKKKNNTEPPPPVAPPPKEPIFVAPWRKNKQQAAAPVSPPQEQQSKEPLSPQKTVEEPKKQEEVKVSEEKIIPPVVVEQPSKIRAFLGKVKQKFSFEKEDIAEVKAKDERAAVAEKNAVETKTQEISKEEAVAVLPSPGTEEVATPPAPSPKTPKEVQQIKAESKEKPKSPILKRVEVPEKPKIPTLAALRKEKLAQQKSFETPPTEKSPNAMVKQKSLDSEKKVPLGTPPANRKAFQPPKIAEETKTQDLLPKPGKPAPVSPAAAAAAESPKVSAPPSPLPNKVIPEPEKPTAEEKKVEEVVPPAIPPVKKTPSVEQQSTIVKPPGDTIKLSSDSPKPSPPASPAQLKQQPSPPELPKNIPPVELPTKKVPAAIAVAGEPGKLGTPPPTTPKEKEVVVSKLKTQLTTNPPSPKEQLSPEPKKVSPTGIVESKKPEEESPLQKKLPIEVVKKPVVTLPKKTPDALKTEKTLPKDSEDKPASSPPAESIKPEVPENTQKKIPEPIAVPKQLEQTKKSPPDSPKKVESPKGPKKTGVTEIPSVTAPAVPVSSVGQLSPSSLQKVPVVPKETSKPAETVEVPSAPPPPIDDKKEEPSTSKQAKATTPPTKPLSIAVPGPSKSQSPVPSPKKKADTPPPKNEDDDNAPKDKQKTPQPQQYAFGFNKQQTPTSKTTPETSPKLVEDKPSSPLQKVPAASEVAAVKKEPESSPAVTPTSPPVEIDAPKETPEVPSSEPDIPQENQLSVAPKKKSGSKKKKKGSKGSGKSQEETSKGSAKKKSSKKSVEKEDSTPADAEEDDMKPTCLLSRTSTSSSSGSSTATESSTSGSASTSSTLSAGSSGGRRRRLPSPPEDEDEEEEEEEEQVSLDKICPAKNRPKYRKYQVEDFSFLKVLGKGSFGKVLLAEMKESDSYFAIKCLKKDVVLEDDDVECTMIERKVLLMGSKHPYLCHLFCTFQTESHLFFVMEYLNGGDLMFHIQQSGRFSEERGRFYGAEIVSGLKFLHKKGVMYRDLKLDNILLDYEGHIRIADFGMCKLQIYLDRTADTFCGTPDYMAPEIIKGLRYNQCVDWWAFGVLLYEMLVGQSPFSGADEDELFWSICNEPVHFPRFLSKEAKAVLERLLEKDTSRRLGMTTCAYGDIKNQVFFYSIDWDKLERRELEPPFRPKLKHPLDVQYFDTTFTKEAARLTPVDKEILQSMDQSQFEGFSYTNPHTTD